MLAEPSRMLDEPSRILADRIDDQRIIWMSNQCLDEYELNPRDVNKQTHTG